ncbi:MAG: AAA family ATPase [Myxococcales bacterium]|nr:AAA family ATPase [Myxococcales bacterium]MCB9581540.1 AAA family ATPase [Polyangiaceae bacterium]
MECILLMGVQASGKSTFFKQRFADTHVRVNLDMLKTRHRELLLLQACIDGKTRFVVDNTNATRDARSRYISRATAAGFAVRGYYFQSQVAACLARNQAREAAVPASAIRGTRRRLELPSPEEGFRQLFYVRAADGAFLVEEWCDEVR